MPDPISCRVVTIRKEKENHTAYVSMTDMEKKSHANREQGYKRDGQSTTKC